MANFVLVHGAWIGGWYWRPIAQKLRAAGPRGLCADADRARRAHPSDEPEHQSRHPRHRRRNVIKDEGLSDVVLVGHSYGGMVVTGVADALPEQDHIAGLSRRLCAGERPSLVDLAPPEPEPPAPASEYTLAPLPAAFFGASPEVAAFVDARTSPHADRLLHPSAHAQRRHRSGQEEDLYLLQRSGTDDLYAVLRKAERRAGLDGCTRCPARTSSRSKCPKN